MSEPLNAPKVTRAQAVQEAELKKKQDEKLCADKLPFESIPSRPIQKSQSDNLFEGDNSSDSIDIASFSSAHRTFAEPPSNDIKDFMQAFDDGDEIIEDLQSVSRLNVKYDDGYGRSGTISSQSQLESVSEIPDRGHDDSHCSQRRHTYCAEVAAGEPRPLDQLYSTIPRSMPTPHDVATQLQQALQSNGHDTATDEDMPLTDLIGHSNVTEREAARLTVENAEKDASQFGAEEEAEKASTLLGAGEAEKEGGLLGAEEAERETTLFVRCSVTTETLVCARDLTGGLSGGPMDQFDSPPSDASATGGVASDSGVRDASALFRGTAAQIVSSPPKRATKPVAATDAACLFGGPSALESPFGTSAAARPAAKPKATLVAAADVSSLFGSSSTADGFFGATPPGAMNASLPSAPSNMQPKRPELDADTASLFGDPASTTAHDLFSSSTPLPQPIAATPSPFPVEIRKTAHPPVHAPPIKHVDVSGTATGFDVPPPASPSEAAVCPSPLDSNRSVPVLLPTSSVTPAGALCGNSPPGTSANLALAAIPSPFDTAPYVAAGNEFGDPPPASPPRANESNPIVDAFNVMPPRINSAPPAVVVESNLFDNSPPPASPSDPSVNIFDIIPPRPASASPQSCTSAAAANAFDSASNSATCALSSGCSFDSCPPSDAANLVANQPAAPMRTKSESAAPATRPSVSATRPLSRAVTQVSTVPDSLFRGGGRDPYSSTSRDPFGGPVPTASDPFAAPAPGSHTFGGHTAVDVFDRPAPAVIPNIPGAPPSAPGRQAVAVPTAAPSIKNTSPVRPGVSTARLSPGSNGRSPAAPGSSSGMRNKGDSNCTGPPPVDHIPTPHGYVPVSVPTSASAADRSTTKKTPPVAVAPTQSKVKKVSAAHFHHTVPLPSVVLPGEAGDTITETHRGIATGFTMHRGAYKPASGPVVRFGFGGRVIVCFPRYMGGNVPTPYGSHPDAPHRPTPPGQVRVLKLLDLIQSEFKSGDSDPADPAPKITTQTADEVHLHEIKQMVNIGTAFLGPLSSQPIDKIKEDIKRFIKIRQGDPISATMGALRVSGNYSSVSERLLWELLSILVEFDGSIMSDLSTLNALNRISSPEDRIAKLLLGRESSSPSSNLSAAGMVPPVTGSCQDEAAMMFQVYLNHYASTSEMSSSCNPSEATREQLAMMYASIEALLLEGRRDEAVSKAIEGENWALAIVVGSVCGKDTYQRVVKAYADSHFPKASGLNLLSLVYSSQAEGAVKHGGRSLTNTPAAAAGRTNTALSPEFVWKRNLAAVLSNKVGDWVSLARHIGDRVLQETGDAMAAHFAYLASGGLCGRGKITLLGIMDEATIAASQAASSAKISGQAPTPSSSHSWSCAADGVNLRKMSDVRCLSALRMTEILERALMLCEEGVVHTENGKAKASSSLVGSSITSILGLSGGSKKQSDETGDVSQELKLQRVSAETVLKCRMALCPHKLRLALWLADLGMTDVAYAYAMEAKALVQQGTTGSAAEGGGSRPPSGSRGGKPPVPSKGGSVADGSGRGAAFSKGFVSTLKEFVDRLSGGVNGVGVVSAGFKPAHVGAAMTSASHGSASTSTSSGSSAWGNIWGMFGAPNLKEFVDGGTKPAPSHGLEPNTGTASGSGPPSAGPPSGSTRHSPLMNAHPMGGKPPPTSGSAMEGHPSHSLSPTLFSGAAAPADAAGSLMGTHSAGPPHIASGAYPGSDMVRQSQSTGGMSTVQNPPLSINISETAQGPGQRMQSSDVSGSTGAASANRSPDKTSPRGGVKKEVETSKGGVISNVRKGLLGWLYPDAHDTTENMGSGLDAVYDKATGQWIFPDDSNNPPQIPASIPPPTSVGPPSSHSVPSSVGTGGPPSGGGNSSAGGTGDSYDPLVALMAPPSRVYGVASSASSATDSSDPLAALMAPPPIRIPAQNSFSMVGTGGGPSSGSGPPSMAGAAAPPRFWTPPAPSPSATQSSGPGSAGVPTATAFSSPAGGVSSVDPSESAVVQAGSTGSPSGGSRTETSMPPPSPGRTGALPPPKF